MYTEKYNVYWAVNTTGINRLKINWSEQFRIRQMATDELHHSYRSPSKWKL